MIRNSVIKNNNIEDAAISSLIQTFIFLVQNTAGYYWLSVYKEGAQAENENRTILCKNQFILANRLVSSTSNWHSREKPWVRTRCRLSIFFPRGELLRALKLYHWLFKPLCMAFPILTEGFADDHDAIVSRFVTLTLPDTQFNFEPSGCKSADN